MMSPVRLSRWLAGVGFVVCAVVLAGCSSGPKRYGVSGTVKYKGEPIKAGTISFSATDGKGGIVAPITNGEYSVPATNGLVAGDYQVAITYPDPKAPRPKEGEFPGKLSPVKDLLPPEYNTKSKLTAVIKPESTNDVSFDLK